MPWLFNRPAPVNGTIITVSRMATTCGPTTISAPPKWSTISTSHFTLRDQVRYANYVRDAQITEPQILSATLSTPLSAIQINRNQIGVNSIESQPRRAIGSRSRSSRPVSSATITAGIEADKRRLTHAALLGPAYPPPAFSTPTYPDVLWHAHYVGIVHTTALTAAAYVLDTIEFGRHWTSRAASAGIVSTRLLAVRLSVVGVQSPRSRCRHGARHWFISR